MTNEEQIHRWHTNPPAWAKGYKARDWDTADEIARRLDMARAPVEGKRR